MNRHLLINRDYCVSMCPVIKDTRDYCVSMYTVIKDTRDHCVSMCPVIKDTRATQCYVICYVITCFHISSLANSTFSVYIH